MLFIDDVGWDCFFQLAAGIKKAGLRTVRITRSRRTRAASLLLFDRTIHLADGCDHIDLTGMLEGEHIVDVQMTESVATAAGKGFTLMPPTPRTEAWGRRAAAMDKFLVAGRLRGFGLSTPPTLPGSDGDADRIIEELGLPVMRKLRTGSGGEGMSIINTRQELETLLAESPRSDSYFFERWVDGRQLQVGGVFGPRADVVATYETLQRRGALAPASLVRVIDDPSLAQTGRAAVAALGISGFTNINLIRDADGRDWIHDVNPRVFGTFMVFRQVGVDFLRPYVEWLLESSRGQDRGLDGTSLSVFPAAFRADRGEGGRERSVDSFVRVAYPYLRWAGAHYVAYEMGRQLVYEVNQRRGRSDSARGRDGARSD